MYNTNKLVSDGISNVKVTKSFLFNDSFDFNVLSPFLNKKFTDTPETLF